jgi:MFS superfamily sulfate permease-like transporter
MFSTVKNDLPASIVVFLVALPLCLGVALASGAPLLSGIIAGIIGGLVVGAISESHASVSGPAAGLAAVVLSSITQLGGSFETFLLAVVLAGAIQLVAGIAKSGFIANYIPSNVIKGLLAAIGIILILKQIPHAVGFDRDTEDDFTFFQKDGENTFSELLNIFNFFSWGAIAVSAISLLILIYWDKTPLKKVKVLPASLFVVVFGVVLNAVFQNLFPNIAIAAEHLVNIPKFEGINSMITLPNFASIGNPKVWFVAFTIAIIASLETLLNLEAVENIDPRKRQASPNRELVAQGIGNILAGMVGGIPITSVIVRSSVNINAGAESKLSAILHGVFLLVSIVLLSPILNLIPLASLAAILIFTGYKLAKISLFKEMYSKGQDQFIPFIATILAIVFTDLLLGVLIGLAISIFYILKSNFLNPFVLQKETMHKDETMRLELPNQVSFLNKASIKDTLWSVPHNSKVVIDATYSDFIDNDVLEIINDFKTTVSKDKNIKLNIIGLKEIYKLEDHIQFVNVLDKAAQQKLTADSILDILKSGNERFVHGNSSEKYLKHQVNATSFGQNPFAIILSCIDSRTTAEHIFDLGLGDIFSIRIAGNILNEDILGSMEFGVHEIGVKLIVVLGHSKCGAIVGACNHVELGNLTALLEKVKPAIENEKTVTEYRNGSNSVFVDKVSEQNVLYSIERIRQESTLINELEKAGKIKIVGGFYDVETGKVNFYE